MAGLFVYILFNNPEEENQYFGIPQMSKDFDFNKSAFIELFMMGVLVYVYCSLVNNPHAPKYIQGIAIGSVYYVTVTIFKS